MDKSHLDLRRIDIAFGIKSTEALQHARRLLHLAEKTKDKKDAEALFSAVIVFSIAYLAQEVDHQLITALATEKLGDGLETSADFIRRSLPNNLIEKLRLLPTKNVEADLSLDESLHKTRQLIKLIRLRNKLIHQEGEHLIGPLGKQGSKVQAKIDEKGELKISLSLEKLKSPYDEVGPEKARSSVKLVEEFFDELQALTRDSFEGTPAFFRWSS